MKDSSIKKAKESAKATAKKTAKKAVKVTAKVTTATAATGLGGVLVGAAAGEAAGIDLDKSDVLCSSRSLVHDNINTGIFERELSVTIQKPVNYPSKLAAVARVPTFLSPNITLSNLFLFINYLLNG